MSTIKIQGKEVFFKAIESVSVDSNKLIIETISGKEYSKEFPNNEKAENVKSNLVDGIIFHDSL